MESCLYSFGRHLCDLWLFKDNAEDQKVLRDNIRQDPAATIPAEKTVFTVFSGTDVCIESEKAFSSIL